MKKNTKLKYTDEPMNIGKEVSKDFFPSPEDLVLRPNQVRVTLTLDADTITFFKSHAKKLKVPYQKMIRNLLNHYRTQMH